MLLRPDRRRPLDQPQAPRRRKTAEAAKLIKEKLPRPPGVRVQCSIDSDRSDDKKLNFRVYGNDVARLGEVADEVAEVIAAVPASSA